MIRERHEHGFGPFYAPDSRILILGSFPSVKSREACFFYGHPQNRFWKVISALCECGCPESLEDKKAFLLENRIALYDVIESCSIIGSQDSTIEDVTAADLEPILKGSRIGKNIYVNGGKAYELYMRYIFKETAIEPVKLPSTSPANAAYSLDRLIEILKEKISVPE